MPDPAASTPTGGGAAPFLYEPQFAGPFTPAEMRAVDNWQDFFRMRSVRQRWLDGRVPAFEDADCFGPLPPPSFAPRREISAELLARHVGHEMRLALGGLLTDALTAAYALRQIGLLGEDVHGTLRVHVVGAEDNVEGTRAAVFQVGDRVAVVSVDVV